MAALTPSGDQTAQEQPKQYYRYRLFYAKPLEIEISSQYSCFVGNNGKKFPRVATFMSVGFGNRDSAGNFKRTSISLPPDDWYRWMIVVGELLAKSPKIYLDNHIADDVTDDDFKIVNFKGEVLQMVPLMSHSGNDYVAAVRIIINDPANFNDFPLIDIKTMYNVLNKIDVLSMGMMGAMMGELVP